MCVYNCTVTKHAHKKRCSQNALVLQGVSKPKPKPSQAVRIARGPDGTRGFTAALQPGNRARLLPPSPTPAEPPAQPSTDGQGKMCMHLSMCCVVARILHPWCCSLAYPVACSCRSLHISALLKTFLKRDSVSLLSCQLIIRARLRPLSSQMHTLYIKKRV